MSAIHLEEICGRISPISLLIFQFHGPLLVILLLCLGVINIEVKFIHLPWVLGISRIALIRILSITCLHLEVSLLGPTKGRIGDSRTNKKMDRVVCNSDVSF